MIISPFSWKNKDKYSSQLTFWKEGYQIDQRRTKDDSVTKCLPQTQENLSQIHGPHIKIWTWYYFVIQALEKQRQVIFWIYWLVEPSLISSPHFEEDPLSQRTRWMTSQNDIWDGVWPPPACLYVDMHTLRDMCTQ